MIVDTSGHPHDVRVVKGVNSSVDYEAVDCVKGMKFPPATREGKPVMVQIKMDLDFRF